MRVADGRSPRTDPMMDLRGVSGSYAELAFLIRDDREMNGREVKR
jgi:hypothetical protein